MDLDEKQCSEREAGIDGIEESISCLKDNFTEFCLQRAQDEPEDQNTYQNCEQLEPDQCQTQNRREAAEFSCKEIETIFQEQLEDAEKIREGEFFAREFVKFVANNDSSSMTKIFEATCKTTSSDKEEEEECFEKLVEDYKKDVSNSIDACMGRRMGEAGLYDFEYCYIDDFFNKECVENCEMRPKDRQESCRSRCETKYDNWSARLGDGSCKLGNGRKEICEGVKENGAKE